MHGNRRSALLVLAVVLCGAALFLWQGRLREMQQDEGGEEMAMGAGPREIVEPSDPEAWSPAPATLRKEAESAVRGQLEAFKSGDYETAITYQSEMLRQNFASPDHFRQMMEANYPQFAHYKRIEFQEATVHEDGKHVQLSVQVTGEDGVTVSARYLMVREQDQFRVEGVEGGSMASAPPGDRT